MDFEVLTFKFFTYPIIENVHKSKMIQIYSC